MRIATITIEEYLINQDRKPYCKSASITDIVLLKFFLIVEE